MTDKILRDLGPVYAETDLNNVIVEPWNGISSLAFLVPALIWILRYRNDFKTNSFYIYCACLLMIGGIGSTIYHLFRLFPIFIVMDWLPIAILCTSVSIYLWNKVIGNVWFVMILTILVVFFRFGVHTLSNWDTHMQINIGYFVTASYFFIPALVLVFKNHFHKVVFFLISLSSLVSALIFRYVDVQLKILFMPMGTHFLWHVMCAIGAFYLGEFIISIDELSFKKYDVE